MKLLKYINPGFVLKRRHLLRPYARNYARDAGLFVLARGRAIRVFMAEKGWGWTTNDRRLAALRDIHRGRRAFVIGNGPSLRTSDLERLSREITFASNRIHLAFDEIGWRPTYYASYYPSDIEQYYEVYNSMDRTVKFFPMAAKKTGAGLPNTLFYRHEHRWFYPQRPEFSLNALSSVSWGGTITYILFQLAFYMGIREVFLLGVDNSFHLASKSEQTSYEYHTIRGPDPDHFSPKYFKSGEVVFGAPSAREYELAYESARTAFESNQGRIFNATRGGKLDLFPRMNFDDLFDTVPAVGMVDRSL